MLNNLLNMSNEELRTWFRTEVIESTQYTEWERRLKEYHDNIECDFQDEWSKKHFKWFFKKRRQKKLKAKIVRRHSGPIFWIIEEAIEDMLPKVIDENVQQFTDIKDIAIGNKDWFVEE